MNNIRTTDNEDNGHEDKDIPSHPAITIAISSGKGGVGKTNISTNLGIELAKTGKRVCIFDADTSLANINILLNLNPTHTLEHFFRDDLSIDEIMMTGPENLKIIPAATGIADFILLDQKQQTKLVKALESLERSFDYLLIDTAAGISDSVIQFIQSAQYAVIVISPEPTSLTDAFSLVKVLKRKGHKQPIYVLVNMTDNYAHSMEIYRRFAHAVSKYIQTKVRYLGYIPTDKAVQTAILSQIPLSISAPDSPAGRCITLLASILVKHFSPDKAATHKISHFWRSIAQLDDVSTENHSKDTATPTTAAENTDVTERQKTRIIDETMTQQEAESLLADLIQFYLGEFGTLPEQAIDLIMQAYVQEQLSDTSLALLQQQTLTSDSSANNQSNPSSQPSNLKKIEAQIDSLVADAEQTKQQLTKLADHLNTKFRQIYNRDISVSRSTVRAINSQKNTKKALIFKGMLTLYIKAHYMPQLLIDSLITPETKVILGQRLPE